MTVVAEFEFIPFLQIDEIFATDRQLAKELLYDMKQQEAEAFLQSTHARRPEIPTSATLNQTPAHPSMRGVDTAARPLTPTLGLQV